MEPNPELVRRATEYAQERRLLIENPLGSGVHGSVFACRAQLEVVRAAIKIHVAERDKTAFELLTRFLFSCLVDADWDDTGDHERKGNGWPKPADPEPLAPGERLRAVLSYIEQRRAACRDDRIRAIRAEILAAALKAALLPAGLFEITVPTGGGKTLSGFAFALAHAAEHGRRRVIYVAPSSACLTRPEMKGTACPEQVGQLCLWTSSEHFRPQFWGFGNGLRSSQRSAAC